ncbi:MAG: SDR family NAD(P)-dependent oxidoreductase [Pseudomonadota bacterium]
MGQSVFAEANVAVITGAAMGIGRAAAIRCAELGMSVCLADLGGEDLNEAQAATIAAAPTGSDAVLACATDVGEFEQLQALASQVGDRFGPPQFLMNNAVTRIGREKPVDLGKWRRAMDVNFWGVVQGVEAFRTSMVAANKPARIVNVGSKQGITNPPGNTIYNTCKAAVKHYTEALEHELRNENGGDISAHLLIPGWTTTGKSEHKQGAWLPRQVVDFMIEAVNAGSFYILCPDDEVSPDMDQRRVHWAAGDITENRPPLSRWHPDFKEIAAKACN